jgi:hypothetical protein
MSDQIKKEMSEFFDKMAVAISKLMLEQMDVGFEFYRCVGDSGVRGDYILYLHTHSTLEGWVSQKTDLKGIGYADALIRDVVEAWRHHKVCYTLGQEGRMHIFRRQDLKDFIKSREH